MHQRRSKVTSSARGARAHLRSIEQLDEATRRIVLQILNHPIVTRLKAVQQLGFTSRVIESARHTRWDHTLWTLGTVISLLDSSPGVPKSVKQHVLATTILQDVGHSPFSNSLGTAFSGPWYGESQLLLFPPDKIRSIRIIEMVERSEQFFSKIGLDFNILIQLLGGKCPWRKYSWLLQLIDGALDADRMAYVDQDSTMALRKTVRPLVNRVARSLLREGPAHSTTVSIEGVDDVESFIRARADLFTSVYYHLQKLAWEHVMKSVLLHVWGTESPSSAELGQPKDIESFLRWTDEQVISLYEMAGRVKRGVIADLNTNLRNGSLMVGEIEELGTQGLLFAKIEDRLAQLEIKSFPDDILWIVRSDQLEQLIIYAPYSIIVKEKESYRYLEQVRSSFAGLSMPLRRRPIIIGGMAQISRFIKKAVPYGLSVGQLQPIALSPDRRT